MKPCLLFEILYMVQVYVLFCEPIKPWINVKNILNFVIFFFFVLGCFFFFVTDFSKIRLYTEIDWQIGKGLFYESDW